MMEKRQRKVSGIEAAVKPPVLIGSPTADVTLVGWGSTDGVIRGLGRGLVRFAFPKKDETFDVVEKRFDKLKTVG
jgi:hypothetical protein